MNNNIKQKLKRLEKNGYLEDITPTLAANNKKAFLDNWPNLKTIPSDIENWRPGQGVGLICRRVVAVDIDIEHSTENAEAIHKIAIETLGDAPYRIGKKPKRLLPYRLTGDRLKKKALKFFKDGIEEKIEILGEKQHFVCYGTHPNTGQHYTWHDGEICDIHINELSKVSEPQINEFIKRSEAHLLEQGYSFSAQKADRFQFLQDRKPIGDPLLMADPNLIKDALDHIPNNKDQDQTEIRTHDDLIPYVAAIKAALGGKEEYYNIYLEWMLRWSDNTDEYIRARWNSIQNSQVGAEFIFNKAEKFGWINPEPEWVKELNQNHFVAPDGKDTYAFQETDDPIFDGRRTLHCQNFSGLKKLHDNQQVRIFIGEKEKHVGRASAWLKHSKRRTYDKGLIFFPNKQAPEGYYNLWQDWGVKPKQGCWKRMKHHLLRVICGGDENAYNYFIGWMAQAIQHPDKQGEVAIVIHGAKGVGKNTIGNYFSKIFGQHYLYINNSKHLTGNFNAHLRDAVFVVIDEAFFAGDKQADGILKSIITEQTLPVERKGKDLITCRNYTHIMMFSNNDWVIRASSKDERRYFILNVPAERKQGEEYFNDLYHEMNNDGPAAMLFDLLNYDLSGFRLRNIPQTQALMEQKLRSLDAPVKWLFDCLYSGEIGPWAWENERFLMQTQKVHEHYERHHTKYSFDGKPLMDSVWSKAIRAILHKNNKPLITDGGKPTHNGIRVSHTSFPSLTEARAAFDRYINSQVDWPEVDDLGFTLDDMLD